MSKSYISFSIKLAIKVARGSKTKTMREVDVSKPCPWDVREVYPVRTAYNGYPIGDKLWLSELKGDLRKRIVKSKVMKLVYPWEGVDVPGWIPAIHCPLHCVGLWVQILSTEKVTPREVSSEWKAYGFDSLEEFQKYWEGKLDKMVWSLSFKIT